MMPPFTRHNPLLLPFSRSSLDNIKSLLKDGKLSPSVSWHPASDVHIPPITSQEISNAGGRNTTALSSGGLCRQPRRTSKTHQEPYKYDLHNPKHAAVLVALANVAVPPDFFRNPSSQAEVMPAMLLEVRSSKMRSHAGEVSFAGGKADSTDRSLLDTAIRETSEELGVKVDQIEYLGRFAEPEVSYGGLVVWPFLAYIHSGGAQSNQQDKPLAALDVTRLKLSTNEVQNVVALPLPSLKELGEHPSQKSPASEPEVAFANAESTRTRLELNRRLFRDRVPYDVVDVSHVPVIQPRPAGGSALSSYQAHHSQWEPSMVSQGLADEVEIWGLTGWFLDVFLRKFGIWDEVDRSGLTVGERNGAHRSAL